MIVKNKQITALLAVLNYPMKFSLARQRDKFSLELTTKYEEWQNDIQKIYKEFCDKDEKGEPIFVNTNHYTFTKEGAKESVDKEYEILAEEKFTLKSEGPIHDFINNSPVELKVGDGDLVAQVLEQTKEAKKKKEEKIKEVIKEVVKKKK